LLLEDLQLIWKNLEKNSAKVQPIANT